jgi:hypothetical protein
MAISIVRFLIAYSSRVMRFWVITPGYYPLGIDGGVVT